MQFIDPPIGQGQKAQWAACVSWGSTYRKWLLLNPTSCDVVNVIKCNHWLGED